MSNPKGINCPTCGGKKIPTLYTRHRPGATVRVRGCRDCGTRIRTIERLSEKA